MILSPSLSLMGGGEDGGGGKEKIKIASNLPVYIWMFVCLFRLWYKFQHMHFYESPKQIPMSCCE